MLSTQVLKYFFSGGATFSVEYASFLIFVYCFSFSVWIGQILSYCIALAVNFWLLKNWTFRQSSAQHTRIQIVRYLLLVVINMPLTALMINMLHKAGMEAFLAKLVVVSAVAIWNYVIYSKLIFKNPR